MRRPLLVTLVLLLPLTACGRLTGGDTADRPGRATVLRVVDGDTVVVRIAGATETVRLIGVDTPETVKPDSPVQCFGPEASEHLKKLIPPGTTVDLVRDTEGRDHFGRLLVYLWRASDRRFVNRDLAAGGFARPLDIAPNLAHRHELAVAVSEARAAGRGLWSACR